MATNSSLDTKSSLAGGGGGGGASEVVVSASAVTTESPDVVAFGSAHRNCLAVPPLLLPFPFSVTVPLLSTVVVVDGSARTCRRSARGSCCSCCCCCCCRAEKGCGFVEAFFSLLLLLL